MPNSPNTSFIPKRTTGKIAPTRSGKRIYIFTYVAYVLFFGTLISAAGIFFINRQAETALKNKIDQVEVESSKINQAKIAEIRELDTRLVAAMYVLNAHAAPSKLFEALESVIVTSVQLDSFEYTRETGSATTLSFGGMTKTFDALLFQREAMAASPVLASATISEVAYGASGGRTIEGANRSSGGTQSSSIAAVTFTFEEDALQNSIGYTVREEMQSVSEEVVSEVITEASGTDASEVETNDVTE